MKFMWKHHCLHFAKYILISQHALNVKNIRRLIVWIYATVLQACVETCKKNQSLGNAGVVSNIHLWNQSVITMITCHLIECTRLSYLEGLGNTCQYFMT